MRGFFHVHRQITDSPVFADAELLRLFIWLLSRASFKTQQRSMSTGRGSTIVTLEPGQCIVGRHAAAEALGWAPSTFRDRLAKLEKMGMADRHPDTHWTIVSIVNWAKYQQVEEGETTGKPTPNRQATDRQPTQKKNSNNSNNVRSAPKFEPPTVDDVRAYCLERNNSIDAEQFGDHYTATVWVQGKNKPIRDWKAAVRRWERNRFGSDSKIETPEKPSKPGFTLDELAAMPTQPRGGRRERV